MTTKPSTPAAPVIVTLVLPNRESHVLSAAQRRPINTLVASHGWAIEIEPAPYTKKTWDDEMLGTLGIISEHSTPQRMAEAARLLDLFATQGVYFAGDPNLSRRPAAA